MEYIYMCTLAFINATTCATLLPPPCTRWERRAMCTMPRRLRLAVTRQLMVASYPLVNIQKTIENHDFE